MKLNLTINDFIVIEHIGSGSYGTVNLVKKKDPYTEEYYALKAIKKANLSNANITRIKNERDILSKHKSRWLVKLNYAFQTTEYLYMAMDFMPGGNVGSLLNLFGCFPEQVAKTYFAEMLVAVHDLHKLNYLHRDLKPENFLIDKNGHLKLADFGLAADIRDHIPATPNLDDSLRNYLAFSIVGTPFYMAPEMLQRQGYRTSCDIWSLGCILFEMVTGVPPFGGNTVNEIIKNVKAAHLSRPEDISDTCWSLISEMLHPNPFLRLGLLDGTEGIMKHPFFKDIDFSNLDFDPPFVPQLDSPTDLFYFKQKKADMKRIASIELRNAIEMDVIDRYSVALTPHRNGLHLRSLSFSSKSLDAISEDSTEEIDFESAFDSISKFKQTPEQSFLPDTNKMAQFTFVPPHNGTPNINLNNDLPEVEIIRPTRIFDVVSTPNASSPILSPKSIQNIEKGLSEKLSSHALLSEELTPPDVLTISSESVSADEDDMLTTPLPINIDEDFNDLFNDGVQIEESPESYKRNGMTIYSFDEKRPLPLLSPEYERTIRRSSLPSADSVKKFHKTPSRFRSNSIPDVSELWAQFAFEKHDD
eukprot:TRINITY_DN4955_c0_g1_i1.p1 TRINITY_DN4955_c0_g1~~TRINITY_DN4955_c0_g1_i1.p1  ORF type:complete len:603 (-),score=126.61 TRINITY_DN4955_c0_g1_i1:110-1870(-)